MSQPHVQNMDFKFTDVISCFHSLSLISLLVVIIESFCNGIACENTSVSIDDLYLQYQLRTPKKLQVKFQNNSVTEVLCALHAECQLDCPVANIAPTISWVRKKDLSILTSGTLSFTKSRRMKAISDPANEQWILQISDVILNDSGLYECQVSLDQGISSMFVNLTISTPAINIIPEEILYSTIGDTVALVCIVEKVGISKGVSWLHNNEQVENSSSMLIMMQKSFKVVESRLSIVKVDLYHAGNYTCQMSSSVSKTVYLTVYEGDIMAAIHKRNRCHKTLGFSNYYLTVVCRIILIIFCACVQNF